MNQIEILLLNEMREEKFFDEMKRELPPPLAKPNCGVVGYECWPQLSFNKELISSLTLINEQQEKRID